MWKEKRMPWQGVPRIDITLADGKTLADLNTGGIFSKPKLNASCVFTNDNDSDFSQENLPSTYCTIKGRGNTTWNFRKKPYALVFTDATYKKVKQTPFGMPSATDWVLLADFQDPSAIRSPFCNILGWCFGLNWASRGIKVELYINGVYNGLYTFCEKVEVHPDRVNINTNKNLDTDYLLDRAPDWQIDFAAGEKAFQYTSALHPEVGTEILFYTPKGPEPEKTTNAQIAKFQSEFTTMMDTLTYGTWAEISAIIDVPSFARHFAYQNTLQNADAFGASWMFYKKNNGLWYHEPGWDWSYALAAMDYAAFSKTDVVFSNPKVSYMTEKYSAVRGGGPRIPYYFRLYYDIPEFAEAVKQEYINALPKVQQAVADLETYIPLLGASGAPDRDRAKWYPLNDAIVTPRGTYEQDAAFTLNFVKDHLYYLTRSLYDYISPKPITVKTTS